jgi:g-D-glutamyl-meso-diaminopimelate peptidase
LKMNGGSRDFSHWQANARGVDLNHNYNCGFAEYKRFEAEQGIFDGAPTRFSGNMPESEPETASLCNFLRFNEDIKIVLTLHSQGEEIYFTSGNRTAPRSRTIAGALSRMSGYSLATPKGMAAYGGLTDWCISELDRPSFTVECGKGENPLPLGDYFKIYTRLREILFTAPSLC